MEWIVIVVLLAMALSFAVLKVGDLISPWMLTVGVWLAIMFLFVVYGDNLYPLEDQFYICLGLWVSILCITSIVTYSLLPSTREPKVSVAKPIDVNKGFFNFFFLLSMVCTPIYLYQIFKIVLMFGTDDLLSQIRTYAMGEGGEAGGILRYIAAVNASIFIIATWNIKVIARWKYVLILLANVLCAFAIMEKGIIFFVLVILLSILYERQIISIRSIVLVGISVFFLFFVITIARFDETSKDNMDLLDFFYCYILTPSVAFCRTVEKVTLQFGSRSLAFFYALFSKLGIGDFVVEKKVQEFVFVPVHTNVYTVFQPFFQDFGYKGVAFFASVYGVFTGAIYRYCRNGLALSRCLYPYLVEVLVLQFYQENLIIGLSLLFQYLIIFVLCVQKRITFKKNEN